MDSGACSLTPTFDSTDTNITTRALMSVLNDLWVLEMDGMLGSGSLWRLGCSVTGAL